MDDPAERDIRDETENSRVRVPGDGAPGAAGLSPVADRGAGENVHGWNAPKDMDLSIAGRHGWRGSDNDPTLGGEFPGFGRLSPFLVEKDNPKVDFLYLPAGDTGFRHMADSE